MVDRVIRWMVVVFVLAWMPRGDRAAAAQVLYETSFEISEGFDPELTLIGQGGWVGDGGGGNGLVVDFFPDEGQHAFIGFVGPTDDSQFLNVWRPINFNPAPPNPGIVRFHVLMSVEDSITTTSRDDFRWSVYTSTGSRLFSLDFDNETLSINYLLDDNQFVPTGWTFTNSVPYQLEIVMNFPANRWNATLNGAVIVTNLQLTTRNTPLDFGDVDAVWAIRNPEAPGDNFLVFDNYRIVAEDATPNPPPRLEPRGFSASGFLIRAVGTPGARYVLEATTDFAAWAPLKTNTVPDDGFFDHLDEDADTPHRFYRLVER